MLNRLTILLTPLLLSITQALHAQTPVLHQLIYKTDWDNDQRLPCCISGIDWSEKDKKLYLVSDQQNKIYQCDIEIITKGNKELRISNFKSFTVQGISARLGLESIRTKDNGDIYVSSERGDNPVESFLWKGKIVGDKFVPETFPLPKSFQKKQFSYNAGIEGITFSPDGTGLFIINERAFTTDTNGSLVLSFQDFNNNETTFPYKMDNPHPDRGVSEILCFDKTRLLLLERHYDVDAQKVFADIFIVTIQQKNAIREHVLSLDSLKLSHIDNYEGMCFGPRLENGNRTLILISDNNKDCRGCLNQRTDILVLEITGERNDSKVAN